MRNHWIAAVAALALLGGCNATDRNAQQQAAAPAIAPGTQITGTVTLHDPIQIGEGAKLDIKLVDVAEPMIPIAEKVVGVNGQPPYSFTLDFDRHKISVGRTYVVNVLLIDGPRRFLPALNSVVLTNGSGTTAQVVLNAEATPAEKLADACTHIEKHIGGMKTVSDTYTTEDASVGWDAFAKAGVVQYVRVNTNFDKGGSSSVNYAYKDGRPLCAKSPGGLKAKWSVGWNADGSVLFNHKPGGGELDQTAIDDLMHGAVEALKRAQAKVDASRKR